MTGIVMNRLSATVALRVVLLVTFLWAAGCSEPAPTDKRNDPSLKAANQKSMEIYKSKSAASTKNAAVSRPRRPS